MIRAALTLTVVCAALPAAAQEDALTVRLTVEACHNSPRDRESAVQALTALGWSVILPSQMGPNEIDSIALLGLGAGSPYFASYETSDDWANHWRILKERAQRSVESLRPVEDDGRPLPRTTLRHPEIDGIAQISLGANEAAGDPLLCRIVGAVEPSWAFPEAAGPIIGAPRALPAVDGEQTLLYQILVDAEAIEAAIGESFPYTVLTDVRRVRAR